jgi:NAD(P)-dependent dehydrogenase (short-subunit alcohol dehydrogenase family)
MATLKNVQISTFVLDRIPVPLPSASAVFITGSSTGIGNHAALQMAKAGYLVFAGVRKAADGEALVAAANSEGAGHNIVPVLVDVSVSESIASAAKNVSEYLSGAHKDRKLAAIVNNAGIGYLGVVETIPMDAVSVSPWFCG